LSNNGGITVKKLSEFTAGSALPILDFRPTTAARCVRIVRIKSIRGSAGADHGNLMSRRRISSRAPLKLFCVGGLQGCRFGGFSARRKKWVIDQRNSPLGGATRTQKFDFQNLPAEGLEPTRSCDHWILSPARLPVPPRRRRESETTKPAPKLKPFQ
jgi:hypothetical protein